MEAPYDVIIIGAGPAGLSASIYASRYGLKHLVLGEITGGLTTQTFEIGNWLGTENITGQAFADASAAHVRSYGAEIRPGIVTAIEKKDGVFRISLADQSKLQSKTVLLATGTHHRLLNIPGEQKLAGKGVSYCPTCDGFFFKNKTVAVIGGGDSAAEAGAYLANICKRVFVIVRGKEMRAERFWQNLLEKRTNVEILFETNVTEICGDERVEKLVLDRAYRKQNALEADGVFVEIGLMPNTGFASAFGIETDEGGYISVAPNQTTNIEGVWAAGDATTSSNRFRQIVTAASEGAIAANNILNSLQKREA